MKRQDPPSEQLQVIVNLFTQKRLKQALFESSQILEKFPNSFILFNIVGACNAGLKQYDAALENYKKALEIKPDYAEAYFNMAVTLKDKDDLEAAIDCYKQALMIKPNYAEAHNNMGNILKEKGKPVAAIDSYKRAIMIKPNYAVAHKNLGSAQKDTGDLEAAIVSYKKALKIRPDYDGVYKNIGSILKNVVFTKPISGLQEVISSIIDRKNIVKPVHISQAAISLLKFEPALKELIKKYFTGEVKFSLETLISNLSEIPLLFKLMGACSLTDLELEVVFTDIRSALLASVNETENPPEVLRFQSALALQCFTNEYIYNQNDKETSAIEILEVKVGEALLKGEQPRPQLILCLACYKSLHQYEWSDLLELSSIIEDVVTRQILEPRQESLLKSNILVLEKITNKVSSKVRDQYEESPYPRWVNMGLSLKPEALSNKTKNLKLKLFDNSINDIDAPNILIAGCGTGQQPIASASNFKNAKVLAIDLSLSSLAYAKRKTEELNLNIDYMQADILDLVRLDKRFDIIECAGVLHHMDDPMAGWKSLTDCLELGGLMKIALYSELARKDIVRMREEIRHLDIGSSAIAMRSFRNHVINSSEVHHKGIQSAKDFYSLSELRDLLFHVQEHRFTIPQLKDSLSELDLKFCGFEADTIVRDFKLINTGADDPFNLDKWHSYEQANPNTFISMYQFWCQKIA
ncbi:tetratricopeptide repeat protein [Candidatus Thioglobus sp.]|nr:tetratricopeptide repeat protein [Candidatus Thioglobus sp.]